MNTLDLVYDSLRQQGRARAQSLQERSSAMDGTALYAEEDYIPNFTSAVAKMNMLDRHAGLTDGFVCRSTAGRVVRLLQNYDSTIYTQEPEELAAQWGFVWSKDPAKALPFISVSTSPYMVGDCCLNAAGKPRASNIDNNVYDPDQSPEFWYDPYEVQEV